jgi:hypothetical protein
MESWLDVDRAREGLLVGGASIMIIALLLAALTWGLLAAGVVDLTATHEWPQHEFDAICIERSADGDTVRVEYLDGDEPIKDDPSDVVWASVDGYRETHAFSEPVDPGASVSLRNFNRTATVHVGWESGTTDASTILAALENPCRTDQPVRDSIRERR